MGGRRVCDATSPILLCPLLLRWRPDQFIQPGIPRFAAFSGRTTFSQHVGNPLGNPAFHFKLLGKVSRVERLGKCRRQKRKQVLIRFEAMRLVNGNQPLVFDQEIVIPPAAAAAVAGITELVDFHQRRFQS